MSKSIWLSEVMPPGMVNKDGSITPPVFEPRIIIRNTDGDVVEIANVNFGGDGIITIDIGTQAAEVSPSATWGKEDK